MLLKTDGGVEVEVLQELEVHGKKYFLVDPKHNKFVGGVLAKYLICPTAQFDKSSVIKDKAEIV